jgi:hypothetical protein
MALAAALAMAGAAQAAPIDHTFSARIERGPCFGRCPVYSAQIDARGVATTHPRRFTACHEDQTRRLRPAELRRLIAAIDRAHVFALKDEYRARVTDLPSTRVTITRRGRTKTIYDYGGEMVGMPQSVKDVERAIDRASGIQACIAPE